MKLSVGIRYSLSIKMQWYDMLQVMLYLYETNKMRQMSRTIFIKTPRKNQHSVNHNTQLVQFAIKKHTFIFQSFNFYFPNFYLNSVKISIYTGINGAEFAYFLSLTKFMN